MAGMCVCVRVQIFAQILLTFRYGRDDEEVMGLKLSNESVLCVEQVYPLMAGAPPQQPLTKCQVRIDLRGRYMYIYFIILRNATEQSDGWGKRAINRKVNQNRYTIWRL